LLVVDSEGAILVALPLDSREDWHRPAPNLAEFLGAYVAGMGEKFWECRN